jgi:hypothetical protein
MIGPVLRNTRATEIRDWSDKAAHDLLLCNRDFCPMRRVSLSASALWRVAFASSN